MRRASGKGPVSRRSFRPDWTTPWLIGLVASLPYLATLTFGFAGRDDNFILINNPAVGEFNWQGIRHALTSPVRQTYLPTRLILHMLEHRLWGLRPAGYHAVNVLLNSLACAMLFAMAAQMLPKRVAAIAVLLYAFHPTHVESVAWISGRKDVLSLFLMAAAARIFVSREQQGRLGALSMGAILALAVFAMFAKATAVVLPGLLLAVKLATATLSRRHVRGTIVIAILFIAAGIAAFVHARTGIEHQVLKPLHGGSLVSNARFAAHALAEHLRMSVFPIRLSPAYEQLAARPVQVLIALAACVWLGAACLTAVRRWRIGFAGFCVLWFFIALAPTSTIFFPTSTTIADRYLYVPSLAVCLLATWPLRRKAGSSLAFLAAIALAALCIRQTALWRTDHALWEDAVRVAPGAVHAQEWRGVTLLDQDRCKPKPAKKHLLRALELNDGLAAPWNRLGKIHMQEHDYVAAEQAFRRAVALEPSQPALRNDLGSLYAVLGRWSEAIAAYDEALKLDPDHEAVTGNQAKCLMHIANELSEQGKIDAALRYLGKSRSLRRIEPALEAMVEALWAKLLLRKGRASSALEHIEAGLSLLPQDPELLGLKQKVSQHLDSSPQRPPR